MTPSEHLIEMVVASLPMDATPRDESVLRAVLQRLVKLAQFEQLEALQEDFNTIDNLLTRFKCAGDG